MFRPSTTTLFGEMQAKVSARLRKVFAQQSSDVTADVGQHNAEVFIKVNNSCSAQALNMILTGFNEPLMSLLIGY